MIYTLNSSEDRYVGNGSTVVAPTAAAPALVPGTDRFKGLNTAAVGAEKNQSINHLFQWHILQKNGGI